MKRKMTGYSLVLILSLLAAFVLPSCKLPDSSVIKEMISSRVSQQDTQSSNVQDSRSVSEDTNSTKEQPSASGSAEGSKQTSGGSFSLDDVPPYGNVSYAEINGNIPYFEKSEYTTSAFEHYGSLDSLGRCTVAYACVGKETMPTEKRGDISKVKPTGWHSIQYDFVDGKSLYNRCHLIGYQLTAENANKENLITGTRYMNVDGMLTFENMIADYVKETNNHVLYRVTPIFKDDELVARGVEMEAYSVEDSGDGICFNVFAYNVQPGVVINYSDGTARLAKAGEPLTESVQTYIINTNNKKVHLPDCSAVKTIRDGNKKEYKGTLSELLSQGYTACGNCLS